MTTLATEADRTTTAGPSYTVIGFDYIHNAHGFDLADGYLLVVEAGTSLAVIKQTDDYDDAWGTANEMSRAHGHTGGNVNSGGVVIGGDVAEVNRCEAETQFGDGSYECPAKGRRRPFSLDGYHPCNR